MRAARSSPSRTVASSGPIASACARGSSLAASAIGVPASSTTATAVRREVSTARITSATLRKGRPGAARPAGAGGEEGGGPRLAPLEPRAVAGGPRRPVEDDLEPGVGDPVEQPSAPLDDDHAAVEVEVQVVDLGGRAQPVRVHVHK